MDKKEVKISTNLLDMVQLISENEVSSEMGEAFASFMLNPTVVWAKFILTDDSKNANGQRIPSEEFKNLIASGIHMPVKMAVGEINPGHEDSKPLGVITHLREIVTDAGRKALVALAALWGDERPADVEYIKKRFAEKKPVNISWEILYSDGVFNSETNSIDLLGTVLRAATVVGNPAYEGRTPILSVAAKKWSKAFIEELPDKSFLFIDEKGNRYFPITDENGQVDRTRLKDTLAEVLKSNLDSEVRADKANIVSTLMSGFDAGDSVEKVSLRFASMNRPNMEEDKVELEQLKAEVERLTAELNEAKSALESKNTEIASLTEINKNNETELAELRTLKAEAEAKAAREAKLEEVRKKFVEAGIEKDDDYFETNAEKLMKLDDEGLDFMIQEIKAFAEKADNTSSASKKTKIPALLSESKEDSKPSVAEIAQALRENKAKK